MTIYVDRVFLLNAAIDYLLLLTTASLAGERLCRRRYLLWSALGGLYAVAVLLPTLAWLGGTLCRFLFGGILAWGAYGGSSCRRRLMAFFFLLSGAFAGILLALGSAFGDPTLMGRLYMAQIDWKFLLLSTAILSLLLKCCLHGMLQYGKGDLVEITIALQGREITVTALRDTGNTLCDPVSGGGVLVIEERAMLALLDAGTQKILQGSKRAEERMTALYNSKTPLKCCLMPFCSIGAESGLLLAIRSDWIRVGRHTYPRVWLAVSSHALGSGWQALWNGREVNEDHVASEVISPASADRRAG